MDARQLRRRLESVAFTTPVPFTDDTTSVDREALAKNLEALYDAGARVFVPCGNTGEYYSLTDAERIAVVETHVEATGDDAVIVAGAAGNVPEVSQLASAYADVGADAVMVMHPDHTHTHEVGLKQYYHRVCDATDLGVVVYKRQSDVTADVLADVSDRENLVAVKFAVRDVEAFSRAVAAAGEEVTWINGNAERYAPAFAVEGASGYTTGIGNVVPRATLALHDALESEHWDRARTIQRALRPMEELRDEPGEDSTVASGNNVPVVKYGMDLAGLHGGPVREPLAELGEADCERFERRYRRVEETFE